MPSTYEEVADEIRARIENGELPPGAVVPSENRLMSDYGVSRDTANKALRLLREAGLTEARQGAATRVREYKPIRRVASRRLSAETWGAGASLWDVDVLDEQAEVDDIHVDRIEAPRRISEALDIRRANPVIRRSRRYLLRGKPVMYAVSHLPADIADDTPMAQTDTGPGGIYARLSDAGFPPASFQEEVRTRMPTKAERERLQLDRGTPVLLVIRTARTTAGRVVEVNEMTLDGSRYILDYSIEA